MKTKILPLLSVLLGLCLISTPSSVQAAISDCSKQPDGLVSWWRAERNARDIVSGNNGTLGSAVTFSSGKLGSAFKFSNSVNSLVTLPNAPVFQATNNQFTIAAWIKPDFTASNADDCIMKKRDGCSMTFSYYFCVIKNDPNRDSSSVGKVSLAMGGLIPFPGFDSTVSVPNDGQFHHVAATFDGNASSGNCVLYLDGVAVGGGTAPGTIPLTTSAPVIGSDDGCSHPSVAEMDEIQFYNRALSPEEIATILLTTCVGDTAFDTCLPTTVSPTQSGCVTRTARYWFTHVYGVDTNCATLLKAIEASADATVCLGFLKLPQFYENGDNVKDAADATLEAMGLYWRSNKLTGENTGTQNAKMRASPQCRARKSLAVELIAAIANNVLLGTVPGNCDPSFPSDLIDQAGLLAAGDDYAQMKTMTVLLRQFNNSGVTNQLPFGLEECSDYGTTKTLKSVSRDPTRHYSCPGVNDSCFTASPVFFTHTGDIFNRALFQDKISLNSYQSDFGATDCTIIGKFAAWRISPDVGVAGRKFTVTTYNSNFDTVVAVLKGTDCNAATLVDCNDNSPLYPPTSILTFTTDGSNNYYVIAGVGTGLPGRLKVKISSP